MQNYSWTGHDIHSGVYWEREFQRYSFFKSMIETGHKNMDNQTVLKIDHLNPYDCLQRSLLIMSRFTAAEKILLYTRTRISGAMDCVASSTESGIYVHDIPYTGPEATNRCVLPDLPDCFSCHYREYTNFNSILNIRIESRDTFDATEFEIIKRIKDGFNYYDIIKCCVYAGMISEKLPEMTGVCS